MPRTPITNDPDWPTPRASVVTPDMVDAAFAVLFPTEYLSDRLSFKAKLLVRYALEAALELKK